MERITGIYIQAYRELCEELKNTGNLLLEKIKEETKKVFQSFNQEQEDGGNFLIGLDDFRLWLKSPPPDDLKGVNIIIESLRVGPELYAQPGSLSQEEAEAICTVLSEEIAQRLDLKGQSFSMQVSINPGYISSLNIVETIG